MPSEDEFRQQLRQTATFIEESGNEILGDIELETQAGVEFEGFIAEHGGHQHVIALSEEREYGMVKFEYSLLNEYIRERAISSAGDELDGERPVEVEITEEMQEAAEANLRQWAGELEDDTISKLSFKLTEILSSPDVGYDLKTFDDGSIHGFEVTRKIYPYTEDFNLREVGRSVQAVVSIGNYAQNFMQRATGWETTTTGTEETGGLSGDEPETDRTFH